MNVSKADLAELDDLVPLEALFEGAEGGEAAAAPVIAPPVLLDPANPELRTRGILKRRSSPVRGYAGMNGSGKSFAAVRDLLLGLAMGSRVLSTVTILDPESDERRAVIRAGWEIAFDGMELEL